MEHVRLYVPRVSHPPAADLYSREGWAVLYADAACLRRALDANRGDKQLNFQYAQVKRKTHPADVASIVYHLQRSFTEGDRNYEAQFWHARYLFEDSDPELRRKAKQTFERLRSVPMSHDSRHKARDYIPLGSEPKQFAGSVSRIEMTYGFATIDGRHDDVFFIGTALMKPYGPR